MARTWRVSAVTAMGGSSGASPAAVVPRDAGVDSLFRLHYAGLLRLAYCLLGDRTRAEDVVQDAFISIYRNWQGLRDHNSALPYLRSTVINRCRTRLRERVREFGSGEFEVFDGDQAAPGLTSEDSAIAHERHERLALAVRGLPRRQREVIVCRYYLELSVTETATLLEFSEGSVKQHAHRALRNLSVAMGGVP